VSRLPTSESLEKEATAAFKAGQLDLAVETFRAARDAYEQDGDDLKAAEMSNNESVTLLKADRPQEALEAVRGTQEVFLAAGDERRAALAWGNIAAALESCGDLASAEDAYRQATALFANLDDDEARAYTHQALSRLQIRQGRAIEAVTTMQAGLETDHRLSLRNRIMRFLLRLPSRLTGR
jgi:tetratricopeptide (TPR) repeat protein